MGCLLYPANMSCIFSIFWHVYILYTLQILLDPENPAHEIVHENKLRSRSWTISCAGFPGLYDSSIQTIYLYILNIHIHDQVKKMI